MNRRNPDARSLRGAPLLDRHQFAPSGAVQESWLRSIARVISSLARVGTPTACRVPPSGIAARRLRAPARWHAAAPPRLLHPHRAHQRDTERKQPSAECSARLPPDGAIPQPPRWRSRSSASIPRLNSLGVAYNGRGLLPCTNSDSGNHWSILAPHPRLFALLVENTLAGFDRLPRANTTNITIREYDLTCHYLFLLQSATSTERPRPGVTNWNSG